jgi:hypothetical protein
LRVSTGMKITTLLGLAATGAVAANAWQSVSLEGNPAFTVDIPASAGKDYVPDDASRAQGMIMYFSLDTKDSGAIGCGLNAIGYAAFAKRDDVTTQMFIKPGYFCDSAVDSPGARKLLASTAVSNGSPAEVCATSFTKGAGANGYIWSSFSVAAPDRLYHLNCVVNAASQDTAEKTWGTTWAQFAAHVQQSIRLPVQGQMHN